ncbi:hypothetical protein ABH19_03915 [Leptospirillum sp. Group II 'CF-1']|nr:hypothetical protein ABH19_03915 [Leptospirillum sp. Group II 'CF-1']
MTEKKEEQRPGVSTPIGLPCLAYCLMWSGASPTEGQKKRIVLPSKDNGPGLASARKGRIPPGPSSRLGRYISPAVPCFSRFFAPPRVPARNVLPVPGKPPGNPRQSRCLRVFDLHPSIRERSGVFPPRHLRLRRSLSLRGGRGMQTGWFSAVMGFVWGPNGP